MSTQLDPVLIVEPDPELRELIRRVLEAGEVVTEAPADSAQVLTLLRERRLSAVLLDGDQLLDGIDVRQELETSAQCPPVVYFSSTGAGQARASQLQAAVAYVPKPFDIDTLLATVQRAVRQAA